jgi:hypothetical protein
MKPVVQVTNVLVLRAPAMGMARPRGRVGATPAKMVVIGGGRGRPGPSWPAQLARLLTAILLLPITATEESDTASWMPMSVIKITIQQIVN